MKVYFESETKICIRILKEEFRDLQADETLSQGFSWWGGKSFCLVIASDQSSCDNNGLNDNLCRVEILPTLVRFLLSKSAIKILETPSRTGLCVAMMDNCELWLEVDLKK